MTTMLVVNGFHLNDSTEKDATAVPITGRLKIPIRYCRGKDEALQPGTFFAFYYCV